MFSLYIINLHEILNLYKYTNNNKKVNVRSQKV